MSNDRNTFAKRQRETEKKRKALQKLDRREQRKNAPPGKPEPDPESDSDKTDLQP